MEKALDKVGIDENTILVGLSAGGAASVRYITEEKRFIDRLILIAPAHYAASNDPLPNADDFYDFQVNNAVKNQIKNGTTIFVSDDEPYLVVKKSVEIYKNELDAKVIRFENRGHFSFLDKTFPELLEEITKKK